MGSLAQGFVGPGGAFGGLDQEGCAIGNEQGDTMLRDLPNGRRPRDGDGGGAGSG